MSSRRLVTLAVLAAAFAMCRRSSSTPPQAPAKTAVTPHGANEPTTEAEPGWTRSQTRQGILGFSSIAGLGLLGVLYMSSGVITALADLPVSSTAQNVLIRGLALNVIASLSLGVGHAFVAVASRWTTPVPFWRPTQALVLAGLSTIREAADLVARWTVVTVLYVATIWMARETTSDVEILRRQYIDPALVLGPVLGLTAWSILVDYRVAASFTTELSPDWLRRGVHLAAPVVMFAGVFAATLTVSLFS